MSTYGLTIVDDAHSCFTHVGMKFSPGLAFVSWQVDCSLIRENDVNIVSGFTTPDDVINPAVNLEDLEVYLVRHGSIYLINHISCTSV